jgi:HKD family nuclease
MLSAILFLIGHLAHSQAQPLRSTNDTLFYAAEVNSPISFAKSHYKFVMIENLLDPEIKKMRVEIISSTSKYLDDKRYQILPDLTLQIPIELFVERFYTIYIKSGAKTVHSKKLVIN